MPSTANPQPPMPQSAAPSAAVQTPSAAPSPAQFVPTGRSWQAKDFSGFENQVRQQYGITDPQQVNQMAQQLRYDQTQDPAARKTYEEQLRSQGMAVYQPGTLQFVNRDNYNTVTPENSDEAFNKTISGYDQATKDKLMAERNKDLSNLKGGFTGTPMPSEYAVIEPWIQGGSGSAPLPYMPGMTGTSLEQPPSAYMEDGPAGTPQPLTPQQMAQQKLIEQQKQALAGKTLQQVGPQLGAALGGIGGAFGGLYGGASSAQKPPAGPTMSVADMPEMSLVEPWLQGPQRSGIQSLPGVSGGLLAY